MEQGFLVDVICDTSFLIHLATKQIKNIDNLDIEIGKISFLVPEVVLNELYQLQKIPEKKQDAEATLEFIKSFKVIKMPGRFADKELINHIKKHRSIVGTMDRNLKKQVKNYGSHILSFSNDRIVLET